MKTCTHFIDAEIVDGFWKPILDANRVAGLRTIYEQMETTGRIDALRILWKPDGEAPKPHRFWDSDIAKWIEAAAYAVGQKYDAELDQQIQHLIHLLEEQQQPDGYLNSYYLAVVEPEKRFTNVQWSHELYCAGHLMEAAIAYFKATGNRSLLQIACRYADLIDSIFGPEPYKRNGYCGHEEIELALIKLYETTGNDRYLKLSSYFIEQRGRKPYYFEEEAAARGTSATAIQKLEYFQAHEPVREQNDVVGHAVRAVYLYCAMADLARVQGDESLRDACEKLWNILVSQYLYVTGGIGSSSKNEGFTRPYDLPNNEAFCETCASVGLVFFASRMLRLSCDSRYADVLERALYNSVAASMSLDGQRFFYANPLETKEYYNPDGVSEQQYYTRSSWFDCACCPSNLSRLYTSLGSYIYTAEEDGIAAHLFIDSSVHFAYGGAQLALRQETRYPWDGKVVFTLRTDRPVEFTMRIRVPDWCSEYEISGKETCVREKGYLLIQRVWQDSDTVSFVMKMPIKRVYADPLVLEDVGCVTLQRGPVVYCVESADYDVPLSTVVLSSHAVLREKQEVAGLPADVVAVIGTAFTACTKHPDALYSSDKPSYMPVPFTAIPYYVWGNRSDGVMRVFLPETDKCQP